MKEYFIFYASHEVKIHVEVSAEISCYICYEAMQYIKRCKSFILDPFSCQHFSSIAIIIKSFLNLEIHCHYIWYILAKFFTLKARLSLSQLRWVQTTFNLSRVIEKKETPQRCKNFFPHFFNCSQCMKLLLSVEQWWKKFMIAMRENLSFPMLFLCSSS